MTGVFLCQARHSAIGRFGLFFPRLYGSSRDAVDTVFRVVRARKLDLVLAGGVESSFRAAFAMGKANLAFSRVQLIEDIAVGWRFVKQKMRILYRVDSVPETAKSRIQLSGSDAGVILSGGRGHSPALSGYA